MAGVLRTLTSSAASTRPLSASCARNTGDSQEKYESQSDDACGCVSRFASGERRFSEFEENPMIHHDSLRLPARAFMYVPVCLVAMVCAVVLAVPSAVAQTTAPHNGPSG